MSNHVMPHHEKKRWTMELSNYPVLPQNLCISRVLTHSDDDIVLYNTVTGIKAYPSRDTYEFVKRCRGNKSFEQIVSELSHVSGEPPHKIRHDLSTVLKKMEENCMLTGLPSPLVPPRPPPCEAHLYSRIQNVSFEITHACNLHCKHCYSNAGRKRENELSLKEIKAVITQLFYTGVLNVMITGGEPLLHPELFDVIHYIRSMPMSCILFTNGTLITKDVVKRLKALGVLSVNISLDGACAGTHDTFRGLPGSFEKTVAAIKMLKKAGIPVRCNISIHKNNMDELIDLITLVNQLHVDNYYMWPISYSGRIKKSDSLVAPEDFIKVLKNLKKYEESKKDIKKEFPYNPEMKNCGVGTTELAVRSDGTVVPCPPFPDDLSLGNIREKTLAEIWNDSPLLRKLRSINAYEHSQCKTCRHITVCKGGCIANVYTRDRTLTCGDIFECAYFSVYDDYVPVEISVSELSAEAR